MSPFVGHYQEDKVIVIENRSVHIRGQRGEGMTTGDSTM